MMANRNQPVAVACDDGLGGLALLDRQLMMDELLARSSPFCVSVMLNAVVRAVSSSHFSQIASRTTSTQKASLQYASVDGVPNALPLQTFPDMMDTGHATRWKPSLKLGLLGLKSTLGHCWTMTARRFVSAFATGLHPYRDKEAVVVDGLALNRSERVRLPASRSIAG